MMPEEKGDRYTKILTGGVNIANSDDTLGQSVGAPDCNSRDRMDRLGYTQEIQTLTAIANCTGGPGDKALEPEFLPFPPECRRVDTQDPGGLVEILCRLKDASDMLLFHLLK